MARSGIRKKAKRKRAIQKRKPVTRPLRVTVATSPTGVSVAHDLQLVRSAILYADEVELISPTTEMIALLDALAAGDEADLLEVLLSLDDDLMSRMGGQRGSLPTGWRDVARAWTLIDPDGKRGLTSAMEDLRVSAGALIEESGVAELVPAIDRKLVKLSPLMPDGDFSSDEIARRYTERLAALIADSRVHLLADDRVAAIARALISEGRANAGALSMANAGEAAVGSGLIARLPAFDSAPLDELLDLRDDMQDPLKRYRSSVAQMSQRLRVGPFDQELGADMDHLFRSEVEPALADLRDGMAQHGLVREVARGLGTDIRPVIMGAVGSTTSLAAASWAELSTWVTATVAGTPAAIAATQATIGGAIARANAREELRKHELYYLYEVGETARRMEVAK